MFHTVIVDDNGKTVFDDVGGVVLLAQTKRGDDGKTGCYAVGVLDGDAAETLMAVRTIDKVKKEVFQRNPVVGALYEMMDLVGEPDGEMTDMSGLLDAIIKKGK